MSSKVSIATKPLVYSTFRYISNHVWNAIGEYVDNSIQSYMDHLNLLREINPNNKLNVSIKFDIENDVITIRDNAFGIDAMNFQRAFELANIPLDASGLNEFGMGMKVSSIWLSNLWSVETSAYGEPIKKTVIFDLDEVINKQKTELSVIEEPFDEESHYTLITLRKLSLNKPTYRQMGVVTKHLASIYTKYIREGILELQINDTIVSDTILKPLKASYWKTPDSEPVLWKKDIDFSAGNYKVKGFIGILEKMSTNTDNGFLLFRRKKVIGTSYDTKFRPKKLCGDVGSPRYKRIYGELELEGFSVSFTKNAFTQDDDLDAFIEMLADDLQRDKNFKIFEQAQKYTPTKTKKEKKSVATQLVNTIVSGLDKPIQIEPTKPEPKPEPEPEQPSVPVEIPIVNTETPKPSISTKEKKVCVGNLEFYLSVGAEDRLITDPFYSIVKTEDKHYRSVINLKHKFFERFSSLVDSQNDYEPISAIIRTMIVTEIVLTLNNQKDSSAFRMKFDEIFAKVDV